MNEMTKYSITQERYYVLYVDEVGSQICDGCYSLTGFVASHVRLNGQFTRGPPNFLDLAVRRC